jgi:hypothetical protein
MYWLSSENATDLAGSGCLVKGPATVSPVVVVHTRILRSSKPERMCWRDTTDQIESACPVKRTTDHEREGDVVGSATRHRIRPGILASSAGESTRSVGILRAVGQFGGVLLTAM